MGPISDFIGESPEFSNQQKDVFILYAIISFKGAFLTLHGQKEDKMDTTNIVVKLIHT